MGGPRCTLFVGGGLCAVLPTLGRGQKAAPLCPVLLWTVSWRGGARPTCQAPWPPSSATPASRRGIGSSRGQARVAMGDPCVCPSISGTSSVSQSSPILAFGCRDACCVGADRAGRGRRGSSVCRGPSHQTPPASIPSFSARGAGSRCGWLTALPQTGRVPAGPADGRAQDGRGFLPPVLSPERSRAPCFKRCRERDPLGPGAVSSQRRGGLGTPSAGTAAASPPLRSAISPQSPGGLRGLVPTACWCLWGHVTSVRPPG